MTTNALAPSHCEAARGLCKSRGLGTTLGNLAIGATLRWQAVAANDSDIALMPPMALASVRRGRDHAMAMRLIRLFTGDDGQSHFAVGEIEWHKLVGPNALSGSEAAQSISFEETAVGSSLDWHNASHRQYVVTLSGRLQFETRTGAKQIVEPGDVMLAEDTTGGGHRWRLIDDQPWRRVYVHLP